MYGLEGFAFALDAWLRDLVETPTGSVTWISRRIGAGEVGALLMMSTNGALRIEISRSASPLVAESAARALMEELAAIPRIDVQMAQGPPAGKGAKSVVVGLAAILVAASGAGALLPTIVSALRDWLVRQPPGTAIKIKTSDLEVEWSGTTPPQAINDLLGQLVDRARPAQ